LSILGSWYARRLTGQDVGMFYDTVWIHRIRDVYIADGSRFAYYENTVSAWASLREMVETSRESWFHVYKPKPGDVVVDVGAGVGTDTFVFANSVGPTGTVFAIEAHPTTYRSLKKLCQLNHLHNVRLAQCAIIDKRGTVYIDDLEEHFGNAVSLWRRAGTLPGGVPGLSLDEFCETHGIEHIDFLKMNIEGAERLAIDGMKHSVEKIRHICVACHDFRANRGDGNDFRTKDLVTGFLLNRGFQITTRQNDPRDFVRDHIHAVRRGCEDSAVGREEAAT